MSIASITADSPAAGVDMSRSARFGDAIDEALGQALLDVAVLGLVALGFVGAFMLQALSESLAKRRWVRAVYVHAMNGFYIDIPARRLTAWFYGQSAPVQ